MTAKDPLHVEFFVSDETTAHWLDAMIARAGGDPDAWFNALIETDRLDTVAQSGKELVGLAKLIAPAVREAVAAEEAAGGDSQTLRAQAHQRSTPAERAARPPRPHRPGHRSPSPAWRHRDRGSQA